MRFPLVEELHGLMVNLLIFEVSLEQLIELRLIPDPEANNIFIL